MLNITNTHNLTNTVRIGLNISQTLLEPIDISHRDFRIGIGLNISQTLLEPIYIPHKHF